MRTERFLKPLRLTFLLAALCSLSRPAASQTPPTGEAASQKADELFLQGKAFYKQNKLREARNAYLDAWNLKHSYDIAANLANAELQIGMKRDATEHFAFCIRTFPATGAKAQLDAAKARFEEARKEVGALVLKTNVEGADLFVDSKPLGRAPLMEEVFVDPGARTVEARLAGYQSVKQVVQVAKGPTQTVTLALVITPPAPVASAVPLASASSTPPPASSNQTPPAGDAVGPNRTLLLVGGLIAAGGLGAGIGLTVAANGKAADVATIGARLGGRSTCAGTPASASATDCKDVKTALTDQSTFSNAALAGFAVGGAFALATAGLGVWAIMTPKKEVKATVRAVPVAGAQGGGLSLVGTW